MATRDKELAALMQKSMGKGNLSPSEKDRMIELMGTSDVNQWDQEGYVNEQPIVDKRERTYTGATYGPPTKLDTVLIATNTKKRTAIPEKKPSMQPKPRDYNKGEVHVTSFVGGP